MKVYIVTSGVYSDYGIEAVFSSVEKAQAFIDKGKKKGEYGSEYNDAHIEEYELDRPEEDWCTITVRMGKDGDVKEWYFNYNGESGFLCFDINKNLVWGVKTDDETRAIKVVNEKRIQILAQDLWNKIPAHHKILEG